MSKVSEINLQRDHEKLYRDFAEEYKLLSEWINLIQDETKTQDSVGKSHPMSFALYVREFRGLEEATKRVMRQPTWKYFLLEGRALARYIVEFKSVPKGKVKAVEAALRLFMSMRRNPRKLGAWWKKNSKSIQLILESKGWPERNTEEGSEEAWKLGPFTVHNTAHAPKEDLAKTEKAITSAAKFLGSSSIPKARNVLYGPIMLVKKLQQPRTLAWYYPSDDKIYLRLHMKVGRGEVHNLIHELGHRYWAKLMGRAARNFWAKHHRSLGNIGDAASPELDEDSQQQLAKLDALKEGDTFPIKVQGMIRNGPNKVVEVVRRGSKPLVWTIENKKGKRARISRDGFLKVRMNNSRATKTRAQYPTAYASTSLEEHFCESFALYAMGKLPIEHQEAFEDAVKGGF